MEDSLFRLIDNTSLMRKRIKEKITWEEKRQSSMNQWASWRNWLRIEGRKNVTIRFPEGFTFVQKSRTIRKKWIIFSFFSIAGTVLLSNFKKPFLFYLHFSTVILTCKISEPYLQMSWKYIEIFYNFLSF